MSLLNRLRAWMRRSAEDAEMDEELRFHLEMETEQNVRGGMGHAEARRQATIAFGGVERWRERIREARGPLALEGFIRDLRHAGRSLRRSPAFLVGSVLALGLGIGSNAAIASAVRAIVFAPPPLVEDPGSLVVVGEVYPGRRNLESVSQQTFQAWQEGARTVLAIGGAQQLGTQQMVRLGSIPESAVMQAVSPGFFGMLGVTPIVGRDFESSDVAGSPVAIVSATFHERRLGNDPHVLVRQLDVMGASRTIIGVMPSAFGIAGRGRTEVWVPMTPGSPAREVPGVVVAIARRRPGVSDQQIVDELTALIPRRADITTDALRGIDGLRGGGMQPGYVMLIGAASLSLLITCTNLALFTVARGLRRSRERALQAALGASRSQIVRGQMAEGLLLAAAGGAVSILVAQLTLRLLAAFVDPVTALALRLSIDLGVYALVALLVAVTGVTCGLLPSLSIRVDVVGALKGKAQSGGRPARTRRGLVVAEVALTTMLMTALGLLAKGARDLAHEDPGFDRTNVLAVRLDLAVQTSADLGWEEPLLQRLRALPGARSASLAAALPNWGGPRRSVSVTPTESGPVLTVSVNEVTRDYFAMLGLGTLVGRSAGTAITDPAGVVVSRALAEALWPGASPLGRPMHVQGEYRIRVVTAVVSDVLVGTQPRAPLLVAYLPRSEASARASTWLLIRTEGDPMALAPAVRAASAEVLPTVPLTTVTTLENIASVGAAEVGAAAMICVPLVLLALLLAASGLYGLIAEAVEVRRRELGIRTALGARGVELARLLMAGSVRLGLFGLTIGFVGVFLLDRIIGNLFYGAASAQPLVLLATALLMLAVTVAASGLPALAATRVGPATALRVD